MQNNKKKITNYINEDISMEHEGSAFKGQRLQLGFFMVSCVRTLARCVPRRTPDVGPAARLHFTDLRCEVSTLPSLLGLDKHW